MCVKARGLKATWLIDFVLIDGLLCVWRRGAWRLQAFIDFVLIDRLLYACVKARGLKATGIDDSVPYWSIVTYLWSRGAWRLQALIDFVLSWSIVTCVWRRGAWRILPEPSGGWKRRRGLPRIWRLGALPEPVAWRWAIKWAVSPDRSGFLYLNAVLRIRDVYPGSKVKKIPQPDPHQRI